MSKTSDFYRNLAAVAGIGTGMTFLGHGMWAAVEHNPKFAPLLSGSLDNVLGISISKVTATDWVSFIGLVDIVLSVIIFAAVVGLFVSSGWLKRLSTSRPLAGIYAWGAVWGFLTALSRVTSADAWYPEFWDWVERAPNFAIPLVGLMVVLQLRKLQQKRN